MDDPLLRLIGDRRPEDDAAVDVGLGGVFAGLFPLSPFFSTPLVSLLVSPLFFAGEGVIMEETSPIYTAAGGGRGSWVLPLRGGEGEGSWVWRRGGEIGKTSATKEREKVRDRKRSGKISTPAFSASGRWVVSVRYEVVAAAIRRKHTQQMIGICTGLGVGIINARRMSALRN